jgi:hypothetical protein
MAPTFPVIQYWEYLSEVNAIWNHTFLRAVSDAAPIFSFGHVGLETSLLRLDD